MKREKWSDRSQIEVVECRRESETTSRLFWLLLSCWVFCSVSPRSFLQETPTGFFCKVISVCDADQWLDLQGSWYQIDSVFLVHAMMTSSIYATPCKETNDGIIDSTQRATFLLASNQHSRQQLAYLIIVLEQALFPLLYADEPRRRLQHCSQNVGI